MFYESLAKAEKVSDWFEHNQTRDAMRPGGFGEQVFAAEAEGELPPSSASPMLCSVRTRGGIDTTISALGTILRLFAEQPDWWRAAQRDLALAVPIFEEAITESPVQSVYRTTARDLEFEGVRIPGDTKVQVFISAANRDPRYWEASRAFRSRSQDGSARRLRSGPSFLFGKEYRPDGE